MTSPLVEALDLTRTMLDAARSGDWPQVGRLQERRGQLLKPDLFMHADAAELLPQLDTAQRELVALVGAARADVRRNLLDSQRASVAASAYLDTARD